MSEYTEYIENLEKDLKEFVEEHYIEHSWYDDTCYVHLYGGIMDDFANTLSPYLFDEGGIDVVWNGDYISINMSEINLNFGINLENVFPKQW